MKLTEKSDIWALGCIFYEICQQHCPFELGDSEDLGLLIELIQKGQQQPIINK